MMIEIGVATICHTHGSGSGWFADGLCDIAVAGRGTVRNAAQFPPDCFLKICSIGGQRQIELLQLPGEVGFQLRQSFIQWTGVGLPAVQQDVTMFFRGSVIEHKIFQALFVSGQQQAANRRVVNPGVVHSERLSCETYGKVTAIRWNLSSLDHTLARCSLASGGRFRTLRRPEFEGGFPTRTSPFVFRYSACWFVGSCDSVTENQRFC